MARLFEQMLSADTVQAAWQRANIPFVRYADDFLLLTPTADDARDAHEFTERALRRMGLVLHPEKTQVCRASPKVVFLGEPVVRRRRRFKRRS